MDRPVDAQAHEALRAKFFEEFRLLALAAGHEGGEDHHSRVLGQAEHVIDHLGHALRRKDEIMLGAVRLADPCKEQAQIVVNLRDGSHG
jgi:hypothetical protein